MKEYILKSQSISENETSVVPSSRLPEALEKELNPAQLEAVNHNEGPLLVVAGAGSGKTKTLVYRVARLVLSGVAPEAILLLTFTRKASQEMLHRASTVGDRRCQDVAGGTFHSFANSVLRKYATEIGYDLNFTISDRGDSEDVISLVRKQVMQNATDKRFPKKNTIGSIFGKVVNTQLSMDKVVGMDFPQYMEFVPVLEEMRVLYNRQKKQMQLMDYDDLLVNFRELLQKSERVRRILQGQYNYILVDEYQDTNCIQADIVQLLANESQNVMVVGDDSQSIYSFRGADFKNIMEFPNLFPRARVVMLEENYRSRQPILDLTNAVIAQAREKYTKHLFTQKGGTSKPVFVETDNDNMQSQFVCQKILELREEGVDLKDIAVLIRSGWHSNDLEVEMKSRGIPFVKIGGFRFMETSHVKDVICFAKARFNPLDSISWARVLTLIEGVGPKAAQDVVAQIRLSIGSGGLLGLGGSGVDLSKFAKKKWHKDVSACVDMILTQETLSPLQLVSKILTFYRPIFKLRYEDFNKRQSDLESLEGIAGRYESLETFLSEVTLDPPDGSQSDSEPEDQETEHVTISTIHSAKGLEWHTVFLISAVDGYLPSFQSMGDLKQLEEERRLMYVALTRAETHLFIIKPNLEMNAGAQFRYTGMRFARVSRFLDEGDLVARYTERWNLVREAPQKPRNSYDSYQSSRYGSSYDSLSEYDGEGSSFNDYSKRYNF